MEGAFSWPEIKHNFIRTDLKTSKIIYARTKMSAIAQNTAIGTTHSLKKTVLCTLSLVNTLFFNRFRSLDVQQSERYDVAMMMIYDIKTSCFYSFFPSYAVEYF